MHKVKKSDPLPIPTPVSIGFIPRETLPEHISKTMLDPDLANRFMGLYHLFQSAGLLDLAREMHGKALQQRRHFRFKANPNPSIRLLAIMGSNPEWDNAPIEYLIDQTDIELHLHFYNFGADKNDDFPDHDIVMIALGESGHHDDRLERLENAISSWKKPIINRPKNILKCRRDYLFSLLSNINGLVVPNYKLYNRHEIKNITFPIIIRPDGSHAGIGLQKINSDNELENYLTEQRQSKFMIANYIDYQSTDGKFRKFRIVLIDKKPYLAHLAIGDHWIVHYMAAGMDNSSEKRAEEENAFIEFNTKFLSRHKTILSLIATRLDLDYVVLDCGETDGGRLVLFEADNRGWIHSVDPPNIFPYKASAMAIIFDAFRKMLADRKLAFPAAYF
jgi:glutathione synthase/RimK-type ligase-like ATP-grasp enzyme